MGDRVEESRPECGLHSAQHLVAWINQRDLEPSRSQLLSVADIMFVYDGVTSSLASNTNFFFPSLNITNDSGLSLTWGHAAALDPLARWEAVTLGAMLNSSTTPAPDTPDPNANRQSDAVVGTSLIITFATLAVLVMLGMGMYLRAKSNVHHGRVGLELAVSTLLGRPGCTHGLLACRATLISLCHNYRCTKA
jgi:hypothetical protein